MFSIFLTFMILTSGEPTKVVIPFDGSLMQCQLFGQRDIAIWLKDHPGVELHGGYRCVWDNGSERAA